MNKQISFMIISAIMLSAFVPIVGSERAQAAGANMTNAPAAADEVLKIMTQSLIPANGPK